MGVMQGMRPIFVFGVGKMNAKMAGMKASEAPTDATVWVSETTAHRKHTFTGLKPLVTHWFRVIAIGLNGQRIISDAISRVIL